MFSLLSYQLMDVVRNQFTISVLIYLLCVVFLPRFGFAGQTMEIYPCLAAGYFVLQETQCLSALLHIGTELMSHGRKYVHPDASPPNGA